MSGVAGGDRWRDMAERTTIIRASNGSDLFGLSLSENSDRDEMGVCIETLEAFSGFNEFEQYLYRTAAERTGRHDAPSEAGDLDLTIYSLRKFLRLAMQGNPSVINLLYVPQLMCVKCDARGAKLQELAPLIISKKAGHRYLGYMESQRQRLLGERGQKKVNRPELEDKYGYDTKYAMHILRLGFQGVELLSTGKIILPLPEPAKSYCMAVRTGKVPIQDVLTEAGNLERQLKDLLDTSGLADAPNVPIIEDWMTNMYWENWKAHRIQTQYIGTRTSIAGQSY